MSKRVLKNILKNGHEYEVGNIKLYVITENDVTVAKDSTKGVSPYNTSYGYTNITIDENTGIKWKEGAVYIFVINTSMVVASANRNVRVRIGTSGDWKPMKNRANTILAGSSYMVKGRSDCYIYKSTYEANGALHLQAGSDTTYSAMSVAEGETATATSSRVVRADYLKQIIEYHAGNLHDSTKQDTLVSGTSIKTINNTSVLGSGNIAVQPTLATQTAYTSKGTATKVPTITTNTLGQVTGITETSITFPVTSVNGSTGAITGLATTSEVLTKTNTTSYTPTADYHPATKKYIDDIVGDVETLLAAL